MRCTRLSPSRALAGFGALLALAAGPGANAADNSEALFKQALGYTVQIRATTPLPFDGDRRGSTLGAGFVVDAQRGWIMTNAHVVSRSPSRVEVAFHSGEFNEGSKVYVDPFLDLAIITVDEKFRPQGIAAPRLECGELPRVGHPVGAFGHPWRLQFTGTRGIISGVTAKYRTELLQTDAPINQGNSGGPLISLEDGRIVGINTAGIVGAQNTNFAVAMRYACRVLRLLQEGADPSPPELPVVYFRDVDERKELRVARTYPGDGSLKFQPGDLIREVAGVPGTIQNETQLVHALRGRLKGTSIKVQRAGAELVLNGDKTPMRNLLERRGVFVSGVLFSDITIRDAPEINAKGFMVHYVEPGSIGQAQELQRGDILERLDGVPVTELEQLQAALDTAQKEKRRAKMTLKRVVASESLFTYVERNLPVRGVRMVSGPEN